MPPGSTRNPAWEPLFYAMCKKNLHESIGIKAAAGSLNILLAYFLCKYAFWCFFLVYFIQGNTNLAEIINKPFGKSGTKTVDENEG